MRVEPNDEHLLPLKNLFVQNKGDNKLSRDPADFNRSLLASSAKLTIVESLDQKILDTELSAEITTSKKPTPHSKQCYDLIEENTMPSSPASRWRWTFRRILNELRRCNMRIGLSRYRVVKGASMAERIARIEAEMFKETADIDRDSTEVMSHVQEKVSQSNVNGYDSLGFDDPAQLRKYITQSKKVSDTLRKDLLDMKTKLQAQQIKSKEIYESMARKMDNLKSSANSHDRVCADLERAMSKLKSNSSLTGILIDQDSIMKGKAKGVHANNAQDNTEIQRVTAGMQKVISEIESLERRIRSTENDHSNMLECRVQDLQIAVRAVQDDASNVIEFMQTFHMKAMDCSQRKYSDKCDSDTDAIDDVIKESITSLTLLDSEVRNAYQSVSTLEIKVIELGNRLLSLKKEILYTSAPDDKKISKGEVEGEGEGDDDENASSPRAFVSVQAKHSMLNICEELITSVQKITTSLLDRGSFSLECSTIISTKWIALLQHFKHLQQSYPHSLVHNMNTTSLPFTPLMITALQSPSLSFVTDQSDIQLETTMSSLKGVEIDGDPTKNPEKKPKVFSSLTPNISSSGSGGLSTSFDQYKLEDITGALQHGRLVNIDMMNSALMIALKPMKMTLELLNRKFSTLEKLNIDSLNEMSFDRSRLDSVEEELRKRNTEQKVSEINKSIHDEKNEMEKNKHYGKDRESSIGYEMIILRRNEIELDTIPLEFIEDYHDEHQLDVDQTQTQIISDETSRPNSRQNIRNQNISKNQNIEVGNSVLIVSGDHTDEKGTVAHIGDVREETEDAFMTSPYSNKEYHIELQKSSNISTNIAVGVSTVLGPIHSIFPHRGLGKTTRPTSALERRKDIELGLSKENSIELIKLKDDIINMEILLKNLIREKTDSIQVLQMIVNASNMAKDKRDNEEYSLIEENLKNLTSEFEDLKYYQNKKMINLKKQLEESLTTLTLNINNQSGTDLTNSSSVITTGQCLGCGRLSALQNTPSTVIAHGLETYRAGFKMPLAPTSINTFRDSNQIPLGGSETRISHLNRPMSAILLSNSVDVAIDHHNSDRELVEMSKGVIEESSESYIPQYSSVRPKTTSKTLRLKFPLIYFFFVLCCVFLCLRDSIILSSSAMNSTVEKHFWRDFIGFFPSLLSLFLSFFASFILSFIHSYFLNICRFSL